MMRWLSWGIRVGCSTAVFGMAFLLVPPLPALLLGSSFVWLLNRAVRFQTEILSGSNRRLPK